mmetsp:Transcript_9595/g.29035  ORF Transcript_9595/g.29035 Transcript_9595/m.29035 type:complete len:533 (+) Transcript_9595:61-1659(+)
MGGGESKEAVDSTRLKKVVVVKNIIENYFEDLERAAAARKRHKYELEGRISGLTEYEKELARGEDRKKELGFRFISRINLDVKDFHVIRMIGKGAFGEVFLVKLKATNQHFAMKRLSKERMIARGQVAHAWVERYALTRAGRHPNVVELHFCFQSSDHIYLVMEYVPGGDMLTMLTRMNKLSEDWARFYIAELIMAIDALHIEGIIHRDVKPDNILFGAKGHIRLSDFGLSKILFKDENEESDNMAQFIDARLMDASKRSTSMNFRSFDTQERIAAWKMLSRQQAFSKVGTPNYIAPEVLLTGRYDETSDWWSVGVILYEMLIGYPPFWSNNPANTCRKILGWKNNLSFPEDANISHEAKDLIQRLICNPKHRLGRKCGLQDFQQHPFFKDKIDFSTILTSPAPFVPDLSGDDDTHYFDLMDDEISDDASLASNNDGSDENDTFKRATFRYMLSSIGDFAGYTYTNYSMIQHAGTIHAPTDYQEDSLIQRIASPVSENMDRADREDSFSSATEAQPFDRSDGRPTTTVPTQA